MLSCLGGTNYKIAVPVTDIDLVRHIVTQKRVFCCNDEFESLALAIMAAEDLSMLRTFSDAKTLYVLLSKID